MALSEHEVADHRTGCGFRLSPLALHRPARVHRCRYADRCPFGEFFHLLPVRWSTHCIAGQGSALRASTSLRLISPSLVPSFSGTLPRHSGFVVTFGDWVAALKRADPISPRGTGDTVDARQSVSHARL